MSIKAAIPKPAEIGREALVVLLGAIVAAFVIGQLPGVKAWIKRQWGDTPQP